MKNSRGTSQKGVFSASPFHLTPSLRLSYTFCTLIFTFFSISTFDFAYLGADVGCRIRVVFAYGMMIFFSKSAQTPFELALCAWKGKKFWIIGTFADVINSLLQFFLFFVSHAPISANFSQFPAPLILSNRKSADSAKKAVNPCAYHLLLHWFIPIFCLTIFKKSCPFRQLIIPNMSFLKLRNFHPFYYIQR